MDLTEKKCVPCEGGAKPMTREEAEKYLGMVSGWQLLEDDIMKIQKSFKFRDFREAMEFVNNVADIAESEGHHPDIHVSYSKVDIVTWTHAIKGLSENDFILAAKIDR